MVRQHFIDAQHLNWIESNYAMCNLQDSYAALVQLKDSQLTSLELRQQHLRKFVTSSSDSLDCV
jgi:hypothetical protein